jgi:hypothetical protein
MWKELSLDSVEGEIFVEMNWNLSIRFVENYLRNKLSEVKKCIIICDIFGKHCCMWIFHSCTNNLKEPNAWKSSEIVYYLTINCVHNWNLKLYGLFYGQLLSNMLFEQKHYTH